MRTVVTACWSGAFSLLLLMPASAAEVEIAWYEITELGQERGSPVVATDLNEDGQIVGYVSTSTGRRAFLWSPESPNGTTGTRKDLGVLPGMTESLATGINDFGDVIGTSSRRIGVDRNQAFLWKPTQDNGAVGSMSPLEELNPLDEFWWGGHINNFGQVGMENRLWTPSVPRGTTGTTKEFLPDDVHHRIVGLNDRGQVVTEAELWSPALANGMEGTTEVIDGLGDRIIVGINAPGQLLVHSELLLTPTIPNGSSFVIDTLFPDHVFVTMNDNGEMIGFKRDTIGLRVWDGVGEPKEVRLINPSGFQRLGQPTAINNKGQVLLSGVQSSFLLTPSPVPEPATLLLALIGGLGFSAQILQQANARSRRRSLDSAQNGQ